MNFDERKTRPIIFSGEGSTLLEQVIEVGDEAFLYYGGKLVIAKIYSPNGDQVLGIITKSVLNPDLHPELTVGKDVNFSLQNIFGINKMGK